MAPLSYLLLSKIILKSDVKDNLWGAFIVGIIIFAGFFIISFIFFIIALGGYI
jgi:hypothetical protein